MNTWLDAPALLELASGYLDDGELLSALERAIWLEPDLLRPLNPIEAPPELVETYRIRVARGLCGHGPVLHGGESFVAALERATAEDGLVTVESPQTTWLFLIDDSQSAVLGLLTVHHEGTGAG